MQHVRTTLLQREGGGPACTRVAYSRCEGSTRMRPGPSAFASEIRTFRMKQQAVTGQTNNVPHGAAQSNVAYRNPVTNPRLPPSASSTAGNHKFAARALQSAVDARPQHSVWRPCHHPQWKYARARSIRLWRAHAPHILLRLDVHCAMKQYTTNAAWKTQPLKCFTSTDPE